MNRGSAIAIVSFLLDAPMFGGLDESELGEILQIMQLRSLRDGELLFREGDQGDGWYVVYQGQAEVTKRQGERERRIALLGPRACLGEMAILDGSPRSATVRAVGPCTVLRFPRDAFDHLLARGSLAAYKLVLEMAKVLCERQRRVTAQLASLLAAQELPSEHLRARLEPLLDDQAVSE